MTDVLTVGPESGKGMAALCSMTALSIMVSEELARQPVFIISNPDVGFLGSPRRYRSMSDDDYLKHLRSAAAAEIPKLEANKARQKRKAAFRLKQWNGRVKS